MKIPTGDVDLNKVETGIPILKPGDYDVKVVSMDPVPIKSGKDGDEMLRIKMTLEDHATSRDGEDIHPGFPIFARASLRPTEKYDPVRRHLAPLMDCFLGHRKSEFETEDFIGKVGRVRLIVRSDDTYGESNEVKAYIPKK
jgi:hypothetical protein